MRWLMSRQYTVTPSPDGPTLTETQIPVVGDGASKVSIRCSSRTRRSTCSFSEPTICGNRCQITWPMTSSAVVFQNARAR